MTTITQVLSGLPPAPARTQTPTAFVASADAFLGGFALLQTQQNTLTGQINTVSGEVNVNAATVAGSSTAAANSATNAATSATSASASATTATNQASSASASATTATGAATTATTQSGLATAAQIAINNKYRGALSADPATRPDSTANQVGDEYFNTAVNLLKRFNGSIWLASDINTANLAASTGAGLVGFVQAGTGAVARTLQSKNREIISLADFGSKGDGLSVTENNSAFLNCSNYINSIPLDGLSPISLFIPDGHYKYSYTPTFSRPVRIFSFGGGTLDYVGINEALIFGTKSQIAANAATNDYFEIDNINFVGAANATYGIYFSNWVLQPKVTNCRFLNFGSANMYALTFQGNNWSIDLLDNRWLVTDAATFSRNWCQCLGISNTATTGLVSGGQVINGSYDGGNSRLNALNNWVRFGGLGLGVGYNITGTKSRIVGGGVENPGVGVLVDGTGISLFNVEISQYFETPFGVSAIQIKGNVSSLDIHDVFCNLQNDSFYNSTAKFISAHPSGARVTSMSVRDINVLSASKYALVTLTDSPNQNANSFAGKIQTDSSMLCALGNNYSMGFDGYITGYHNNDLLGLLSAPLTTITTAQTRVSSRCRINAGSAISGGIYSRSSTGTGLPPCRAKRASINWTTTLAADNYLAIEARMDDLTRYSGGIATGGVIARYLNTGGASSIVATLQLVTSIGGANTVIASKVITVTSVAQGFSIQQVVSSLKTTSSDYLSLNVVIAGAGHTGVSDFEIINIDVSSGEFPPPLLPIDAPAQISKANQWWRQFSNTFSQSGTVNWVGVQIGSAWATTVRNIKQVSLAGSSSATYSAFGETCVYVTPNAPSSAFDVVFSVEAEN